MKKFLCIFLMIILMAGLICGCSFKSKKTKDSSKNQIDPNAQPTSSTMITEDQVKGDDTKIAIILYFSDNKASKLVAEKRFFPQELGKDVTALAQAALNELVKGPISGNLTNPFPKGVPVPTVKVEKNTAVVDISKEFVSKHPGGSTGEILTVYAIVNTLTEIKGIDAVEFTVAGKKQAEFKGHLQFNKPFKTDVNIIKGDDNK